MVQISGGTIQFTKGDSFQMNLTVMKNDLEYYKFQTTDTVKFFLFKKELSVDNVDTPIFTKEFDYTLSAGSTVTTTYFNSDDTKYFKPDTEYFYSIVLTRAGTIPLQDTVCSGRLFLKR